MNESSNRFQRLSQQEAEDASEEGTSFAGNMRTKLNSRRSTIARKGLMASVVKAASTVNTLLLENCGMCTVYCDKQVQYEEYVQQQYEVGVGAMEHLYSQFHPSAANPASGAANGVAPLGTDAAGAVHYETETDADSHFLHQSAMTSPPNNTTTDSFAANHHPATNHNNPQRIEVERYYREFLFDEESVVRSVGSRGATDDEE